MEKGKISQDFGVLIDLPPVFDFSGRGRNIAGNLEYLDLSGWNRNRNLLHFEGTIFLHFTMF